ncbi:FKBP-type peptidyl-prolyl cis-trans isomerase [Halieaceae bacterium IMCC14734]|uniref:Peptidyl-prolyl cis-trans isomerase n=1 Tax=Candidatus Litorirhabdus singularis TaxID=2518993 RepID=A0ABT3TF96_9GAMM|nr:FKBP-type peptidyl-prolyl cis-trans isomerase [Candidatus Litorirhabdus singularis]MCX2980446.1 FKBP-type peptidyl-prolyl cis-trans isomerase [Candidatus Litorirhabdus singularis]
MSEEYTTVEQRVSYGIGRQMGDQLSQNSFEGVDVDAVAAGVKAALLGQPSTVEEPLMRAAFEEIQKRMELQQAAQAAQGAAEGEAFLEDNAERAEVTVTASGLQYEVLATGAGDKPTASSTVRTHYHGTLIDGTVFDSSVERGEPAEFPVNGVIAGWTEALQEMSIGSKWRLYVPYQLAYGERGAGGAIGPYTALIFEVELLEIVG